MPQLDKELIARNFSRHAGTYDRFADIQQMAAKELLKQTPVGGVSGILEIGCGTGNYTALLAGRFPQARISAVEISAAMIDIARRKLSDRVRFILGDAEAMGIEDGFDLITSNAAFQWFNDLEGTLGRYRKILSKDGMIIFSIFGPQTFPELNRAIKEVLGSGSALASSDFLERTCLEDIMRRHFKDVNIKERVFSRDHESLMDLLNAIRCTGTRGRGISGELIFKRALFDKLEKAYKRDAGSIRASYQVFFCRGSR